MYQVIARKWRPQNFTQLVGQNHISQTLVNALKNGRLPHALLFTGPRGTGKTSSARILAKSLRCPNAVDFVPCNACQSCEDIALGRSVDVLEIDGASNNGVDAIRELRDSVTYRPSSGNFKVYIIDEVHMLSVSAFNALLKTLEEPPEHVIFIMATTEVHKIPATILSRCQRFDFRRIPTRQISERLKLICDSDGVQAEEDALWVIARQGDGSLRDSQSLLDQVITFANGPLTRENVIQILGLTDRSLLLETITAFVKRDVQTVFQILQKIASSGVEPQLFSHELLESIRNLLLVKVGQASTKNALPGSVDSLVNLVDLPDSEMRFLADLAKEISEEDLHLLFDMTLKGSQDIHRASEPRIVLEMILLRISQAPRVREIESMMSSQQHFAQVSAAPIATGQVGSQANRPAAAAAATPPKPIPTNEPKLSQLKLSPSEKWLKFVQAVRSRDAIFTAKIENLLFEGLFDTKLKLVVPMQYSFLKDQLSAADEKLKLQGFIDHIWGEGFTYELDLAKAPAKNANSAQASKSPAVGTISAGSTSASAPISARSLAQQKEKVIEEELMQKVAEHPKVKSALATFKGQIKAVKRE